MQQARQPAPEAGQVAPMVLCGYCPWSALIPASSLYFGIDALGWFCEIVVVALLMPAMILFLFNQEYTAVLFCFAVLAPLFWGQYSWAPRQWHSSFLRDPGWRGVREVHVSPQGLLFATQSRRCEWSWGHFINWKEDGSSFVMILPDATFEFIPKVFFRSRAELSAFRTVLAQKIERRAYNVYPGSIVKKLRRKYLGRDEWERD